MSLQRHRRLLAGSTWNDVTFSRQDLRHAIAVGATFTNCTFRDCKLNLGRFEGASFFGCHFEDCSFEQAELRALFRNCVFVECNLDAALFNGAILERTYFERCRLEYAVFTRATVIGGGFLGCQLHGTYLDVAESSGVDFSGSNLWGAVIPLGCAVIVGNKFDHRQLHLLLGVVSKAVLDIRDSQTLGLILDPRVLRMVEKLVADAQPQPVEEANDSATA